MTDAFGEPWDFGTMNGPEWWPHLFAYGGLEPSVCRCRQVTTVCLQTGYTEVELPGPVPGSRRVFPGWPTFQDVVDALDDADCPWEPYDALTFDEQYAIKALPSDAILCFRVEEGEENALDLVGLSDRDHDCDEIAAAEPSR